MKDKLIEYYKKERVTGTYDSQREGTEYRRKKRKIELRMFLDLLNKQPKEDVLEIGCSSGFLTKHLGKVTAIDTSVKMLEITRHKNPEAECIEADMFNLPFREGRFDKVVVMRVWNHLTKEDLRKVLREAKRVLKETGTIVFDVEDKSVLRRFLSFFYKRVYNTTGYKVYQINLDEIRRLLWEEGYMVERAMFLNHKIGRQIMIKALTKSRIK